MVGLLARTTPFNPHHTLQIKAHDIIRFLVQGFFQEMSARGEKLFAS
jgi:hypothetical protein